MQDIIRLDNKDEKGALKISLIDILTEIGDTGERYCWSILSLWARGRVQSIGTSMRDLDSRIRSSPSGVPVSWSQLGRFAEEVDEVMEGIFAAYDCGSSPPVLGRRTDLHDTSQIIIELVDSNYWEISCADELLCRQLLGLNKK